MRKNIKLRNGKLIVIPKLGARKSLRVCDVLFDLLQEYQGNLSEFDLQAGIAFIRQVALSNFEKVAQLLEIVSTLTAEDLEADGEEAVGLDEMAEILIAAYEENSFGEALSRLGNALGPLLEGASPQGGARGGRTAKA